MIALKPTGPLVSLVFDDGTSAPGRVWDGELEDGTKIEAYVYAITPNDPEDADKLQNMILGYQEKATPARSFKKKILRVTEHHGDNEEEIVEISEREG